MTPRVWRAQVQTSRAPRFTFHIHNVKQPGEVSANASHFAAPAGARTRCLSFSPSKEGAERRFGAMDGSTRSARARLRPVKGRAPCGAPAAAISVLGPAL